MFFASFWIKTTLVPRWWNNRLQLPQLSNHLYSSMSRPKPGTRICDHDRHANIKPKLDINKNQLNFLKNFTKASLFLFISCFFT